MNVDNQTFQNTKEFSGLKAAVSYSALAENNDGGQNTALQTPEGSFKSQLEQILKGESLGAEEFNIDDILAEFDIGESVNLECINIEKTDAMFFINLLNQGGVVNYNVQNNGNIVDTGSYKNIEVSKTLSAMLSRANETKKAVRLDFDNNITVILKLSNDGKVDARFFPGDKIAEEYLKNNIPYLKQRFEEQNIPYANLSYKQQRQRENGQQNKEKNNE